MAFTYVGKQLIFISLEGGFPVLWLRVGWVQVAMLQGLGQRIPRALCNGHADWRGLTK
jgi:hypothetical protein